MIDETDEPIGGAEAPTHFPSGIGARTTEESYEEKLVLPTGDTVVTLADPVSAQRRDASGLHHEALVREGRLSSAGRMATVIVKTRLADRTFAVRDRHGREAQLLERLAVDDRRSTGAARCSVPRLIAEWAEEVDGQRTGRYHLVMSQLPGSSLAELAADHLEAKEGEASEADLSARHLAQVFAAVAERLEQIHRAGWYVNDINGGSILVNPDPGGGVGLVDFGYATPATFEGTVAARGAHYPPAVDGVPSAWRDTAILAATLEDAVRRFSTRSTTPADWEALALIAQRAQQATPKASPAAAFAEDLSRYGGVRRRPRATTVWRAVAVATAILAIIGILATGWSRSPRDVDAASAGRAGPTPQQTGPRVGGAPGSASTTAGTVAVDPIDPADPDALTSSSAAAPSSTGDASTTTPTSDGRGGSGAPEGPSSPAPSPRSGAPVSTAPGLSVSTSSPTTSVTGGPVATTPTMPSTAPSTTPATSPVVTAAPTTTTTTSAGPVLLVFDDLVAGREVVMVYPGVTTSVADRRSNGGFWDQDVVEAICRVTGRLVTSAPGEPARQSTDWIRIHGSEGETQYATAVYVAEPAALLARLAPC